MRILDEAISMFALLCVITILPCCSLENYPEGFWKKNRLDHLSKAQKAYDLGKLDVAIDEVNRDIRINGATTSNLLMRAKVYRDSGLHEDARKDIYAVHDIATQLYYDNNDPYGLYISAYCLGVLGDEDRARSVLYLIRKRYPYFSLTDTDNKITQLLQFWSVNQFKLKET